jgi:FAD/FMN-containing dehydrogenase
MITVSSLLRGVPPLFDNLAKILAGDIDCSSNTLQVYSIDGSPYAIRPQAVVYPKNATDIKHILAFSRELAMPVTIRGNGTAKTGGALGEGIIIDMSRYFTHIKHINMLDNTITVEAGVSIKELRERLRAWGKDIPLLTEADDESTIGAMLATKNCTPTSFHHGTIREWVEAITVIVDTGEEHRLADGITPSGRLLGIYQTIFPLLAENSPILRAAKPKNADDSTGYNLWGTSIGPRQLIDQLVGSEGTLGIITSATFRLIPHKEHTVTTCIPLETLQKIPEFIALAKKYKAEHIFLYDKNITNLIDRYRLESTPSFKEVPPYTLLISHKADTRESLQALQKNFIHALSLSESALVYKDGESFINRITNKAFIFSLLDAYTQKAQTPITVGDGIIVPLTNYVACMAALEKYLSSLGNIYIITGNAGSGHISIITLFDPLSTTYVSEIESYTQTLCTYIKKYAGGISASGGEGLARTPYISLFFNEATLTVFQKIKKAWDPLSILNPSKKLSVTLNYLHNHLTRPVPK